MKKTFLSLALIMILVALVGLSGCSTQEKVEISSDGISKIALQLTDGLPTTEEVDQLAHPAPEPVVMDQINPLTGEPTDKDITDLRPISVMLNNISVAMPQAGVSKADMIFELMDEGGITRLQGMFMDVKDIERIGTIRSARHYNVETALGYDAILVHAGGSGQAKRMITEMGCDDVDFVTGRATGDTFYRDPSRQEYGIEHSLFAVGSKIYESMDYLKYRREHEVGYDKTFGLHFDKDAVKQCKMKANTITVTYAGDKQSIFTYDKKSKTYTMSQYGATYTDDGVEVPQFKNVLVIYANTYLQDDGKHLTIKLNTGGGGYFFTEGKGVKIKWYKDGDYGPYIYTLRDGTPLNLNIGKSFVCVNQNAEFKGVTHIE